MNNLIQNIVYQHNNPELQKYRLNCLQQFEQQGIPTAKTEEWKYTRLRDMLANDYTLAPKSNEANQHFVPFDCYTIDIKNGYIASDLPSISGLEISGIENALEYVGHNAQSAKHPFVAINGYYLDNGLFIRVHEKISKPLLINYHTTPENNNYFYNIRNVIVCEPNAHLEIIENHTYDGDVKSRYLANIVNEFFIKTNAVLKHYKYQNEAFKATHLAFNSISLEAKAQYNSFCLQKGANIARNETEVRLNGAEAIAEVNSAYRMNGWATIDTTTNIYHNSADTKSSQLIKGVVGGEAKGVFQGKIHIAPNAICSEGNQLHKAILLSDKAEVDVKPELEIFADDVKCSHGAASGELDKEQLFYMQARGIGEDEAKQILIDAYINDVISLIGNEKVQDWFKNLV